MFNSEEGRAKMWSSSNRALWFLIWAKLLLLPRTCSRGHEWRFNNNDSSDSSYVHLHCTAKLPEVFDQDSDEENQRARVHKRCNYKKSWRVKGTLPKYLPRNITPEMYLRTLYWFSSDCANKQILAETKIKKGAWQSFKQRLRDLLWLRINRQQLNHKLGGAGRVVVVDETFFTKKKKNKGGFAGRSTQGNKTLVMGFLELDLQTRRATGACVLITIPNRKKQTLHQEITRYIEPGSLIFTDRFKSYQFLSSRNSAYVHRAVNHSAGEFSRMERIFGEDITQ